MLDSAFVYCSSDINNLSEQQIYEIYMEQYNLDNIVTESGEIFYTKGEKI